MTVAAIASKTGIYVGVTYFGVVGTKCKVPQTLDTTNKQALSQRSHVAMEALPSGQWKIAVPNFYQVVGGAGEAGTGAVMSVNAAVEYPKGTTTRVTFNGSSTGSIADNTFGVSDWIAVAIPKGQKFWIRLFTQSTGGIVTSQGVEGQQDTTATGDNTQLAVSGLTDLTMTPGTIATTTSAQGVGVCAILGYTSRPTVFALGDSLFAGLADNGFEQASYYAASCTPDGALGYMERSLVTQCAYIMAGMPGEKASNIAGAASYTANRVALAAYCKYLVSDLAVNDFLAARTAAQVQADIDTIVGKFGLPAYWCTTTPYGTSTDTFATYGAQTPSAWNSVRATFNGALRAGKVSTLSGTIDIARQVEYGKDTGHWRTKGRVVTDAAITSGLKVLTSATAAFTPDDIGNAVQVLGAAAAGGNLTSFIVDYTSATSVTLQTAASTTVSGATARIGTTFYTIDGVHPYLAGVQTIVDSGTINVARFTGLTG